MSQATKLTSRWTAFTLLIGGCAIVASAGVGVTHEVQTVPQAKWKTNAIRIHAKNPRNHTHEVPKKWKLSKIYTLNGLD